VSSNEDDRYDGGNTNDGDGRSDDQQERFVV
jgi:hypothetical protein